jgi:hypothetical protein
MEDTSQKFKTKTGFCYILPDKIVLTSDENLGNVDDLKSGKKNYLFLGIYMVIASVLLYWAYQEFLKQNWVFVVLYGFVGLLLWMRIIQSRNLSATPVIERNTIKKITFFPAKKFLTRAYFKVDFQEQLKKPESRLIMLPGSLSGGNDATEIAIEIMKKNNLI